MKKIKTIYEYFSEYTKEDIDAVLAMLTEEEKELITLRYGDDLENPQTVPLNSLYLSEYELIILPRLHGFIAKEKSIKDNSLHLK